MLPWATIPCLPFLLLCLFSLSSWLWNVFCLFLVKRLSVSELGYRHNRGYRHAGSAVLVSFAVDCRRMFSCAMLSVHCAQFPEYTVAVTATDMVLMLTDVQHIMPEQMTVKIVEVWLPSFGSMSVLTVCSRPYEAHSQSDRLVCDIDLCSGLLAFVCFCCFHDSPVFGKRTAQAMSSFS